MDLVQCSAIYDPLVKKYVDLYRPGYSTDWTIKLGYLFLFVLCGGSFFWYQNPKAQRRFSNTERCEITSNHILCIKCCFFNFTDPPLFAAPLPPQYRCFPVCSHTSSIHKRLVFFSYWVVPRLMCYTGFLSR